MTLPPFRNTGWSFARLAGSCPAHARRATTVGSPSLRIVTGTSSSWNAPSAHARAAFWCDASAKASCSSRETPHFSATFSAVSPMDWSGKRSAIFGFSKRQPRLVSWTLGGVRAKGSSLLPKT